MNMALINKLEKETWININENELMLWYIIMLQLIQYNYKNYLKKLKFNWNYGTFI